MLGPPKTRAVDRPVVASLEALVPRGHFYRHLEALVPRGHFYRHLEAKLDLSFVRELARDRYAPAGRPSVDPVVFFKLQLIMFFEGIRSERKLVETASLHLAHRWYLGYALDEPLPEHSSLTRIRQRLGLPVFRRFFERVVELCREAGLVRGDELFFDATKVKANADVDSVVPRLGAVVDDHIEELFPSAGAEPLPPPVPPEGGPALTPGPPDSPPAAVVAFPSPVAGAFPAPPARGWDVLGQCRLDPQRPWSGTYHRAAAAHVCRTDPDAALMNTAGGGRAAVGYRVHYVVDGGKARVILYALVAPGDVTENQPMLDLLRRVRFRWRLRPARAVGDTTYATVENIRGLEDEGIRAYVPFANWDRTPFYGPSRFAYDPQRDEYRCPQGQPLGRDRAYHGRERWLYRADPATCNACPVKAQCTASRRGRSLSRSFHAAYLDRVRGYHTTADYRRAMRKRAVWVEPLFGEAKQWHHLRQFRRRRLANVNMEGLLVAAGQNLKRWLAATGWGRRHGPASALALPHVAIHPGLPRTGRA